MNAVKGRSNGTISLTVALASTIETKQRQSATARRKRYEIRAGLIDNMLMVVVCCASFVVVVFGLSDLNRRPTLKWR